MNPSNPAAVRARRTATLASAASTAAPAALVLLWAALSALGGQPWNPGTSAGRWAAVIVAAVGCFVAREELGAIARHRRADAAAAERLEWPAEVTSGPRGADAVVCGPSGQRFAVLVVAGPAAAPGRHARAVVSAHGRRRGVSARSLAGAAAAANAAALIVSATLPHPRCRSGEQTCAPAPAAGQPPAAVVCPVGFAAACGIDPAPSPT